MNGNYVTTLKYSYLNISVYIVVIFISTSNKWCYPVICSKYVCLDPRIQFLLIQAGFSNVAKLEHFKIDDTLVNTLVERWRPESHMFHLPIGECTITLEDVTLQLVYELMEM